MKPLDEKIKAYSLRFAQEHLDEERVNAAVIKSKKALYDHEKKCSANYMEFLYQQSHYISKRWWLLQGLLLAALWWLLQITQSGFLIQRGMGIMAPMFVVLIIPELWKNRSSGAIEIECASYYSLRQIYAARMILFAAVDLVLLSLFTALVAFTSDLTVWEMLIQFFIPLNVTCCICFRILCSSRFGTEFFALLLCMIWVAVWCLVALDENVYAAVSGPVWAGLLIVSALYIAYAIRKTQTTCESVWEVNSIWN